MKTIDINLQSKPEDVAMLIAGLNGKQLRDKLRGEHWSQKLLAQVICSTYWGDVGVDLRELGRLDAENWQIAIEIMSYRRTPQWNDEEFWALAVWCKTEHKLTEDEDEDKK